MRQQTETDLLERIGALFTYCPALSGFSVEEISMVPARSSLCAKECVLSVSVETACPYYEHSLREEIGRALLPVLREWGQEAVEALRGRTFARILH